MREFCVTEECLRYCIERRFVSAECYAELNGIECRFVSAELHDDMVAQQRNDIHNGIEQRNDIHNAPSINVIEKYNLVLEILRMSMKTKLDAEEDKDATLCCRNILVFLDQMFAQNRAGRYS